jgi:hypothetical protein
LLHNNNAPAHSALSVQWHLAKYNKAMISHSHTLSDLFLFLRLKLKLKGKTFDEILEIKNWKRYYKWL